MQFTSVLFLLFFTAILAVYWATPARLATPFGRVRILILLAASYYFYMSWNKWLAALVAATSLADYFMALWMEGCAAQRRRKAILVTSIVMNLGLLIYFKYADFFLVSLYELLGHLGVHGLALRLDVILPVGISFYTFEAISYMVDVYHGRVKAERNAVHFLLFITFFPRMVAGPIIRAKHFLPQMRRITRFSPRRFRLGMEYVLMGLFKKMVIADNMALQSDPVFADPQKYFTGAMWIALVAYSLQIYCDFSGYSDIAVGLAHMLGFRLPRNFNLPYIARNISEFWRRWHISLSTWLRDYVFISLGGSRGSKARTAFTLMSTMALCGLWHGAKWTFVAFGVMHGLFMVIHRLAHARAGFAASLQSAPGIAMRVGLTWLAVAMGWVVFRAQDFGTAAEFFHRLFTLQRGVMVRHPVAPSDMLFPLATVGIAHWCALHGRWRKINERLSPVQWGFVYATLALLTALISPTTQKGFIYFQF